MLLVGLTGGIGAGKSTVAAMLEGRGSVVFDADEFARRAIDPGTPGYSLVVETFGDEVLGEDGGVDREALAALVFHDPEARRRLERIIHPEVARLLRESLEPYRDTDRVVVYSVPLLVEAGLRSAFDVVVVVTANEEGRVARLATDRGMSEGAARARIGAQVSDEERVQAADHVLQNDGTIGELERQVDALWELLKAKAESGTAP
jgi:dephospho-CoA kinase